MISVSIAINGTATLTRSAWNTGFKGAGKTTRYDTDAGDSIYHDPREGCVVLAKKMLDTLKVDVKEGDKSDREKVREDIIERILKVDEDLEVRKEAEENQRKYGTLTGEELQKRFTI